MAAAKKNCEIPQCFATFFLWLSSRSSKDRKLTNEFRKEVKLPEVNMCIYIYIFYIVFHRTQTISAYNSHSVCANNSPNCVLFAGHGGA